MSTVRPISSRPYDAAKPAELLDSYLAESDGAAADILLASLVQNHAEPLVARVVSSRLRRHSATHHGHAEDVTSDAVVAFLLHVEDLRAGRAQPVANLSAFVAMLAARACNDYFRRAYPAFHGLRNKLRYLLDRYPEMRRWKDPVSGIWICGLAEWHQPGKSAQMTVRDMDEHGQLGGGGVLMTAGSTAHPADELVHIFRQIGAPVRFNDLAVIMARLWNVQEASGEAEDPPEVADSNSPVDVTMGHKQWLVGLWKQICDLKRNQRAALLLNLKGADGACAASLIVMTGVATIRQIAEAVEIPIPQFAELWKRMPLSDLEIAGLMGITRQQVINLRKCARERLVRHMKQRKKIAW